MCTADVPFAIGINMNQCIKCTEDKPLFNLGTRECEKCAEGASKKCDGVMSNLNNTANTGQIRINTAFTKNTSLSSGSTQTST